MPYYLAKTLIAIIKEKKASSHTAKKEE